MRKGLCPLLGFTPSPSAARRVFNTKPRSNGGSRRAGVAKFQLLQAVGEELPSLPALKQGKKWVSSVVSGQRLASILRSLLAGCFCVTRSDS